MNGVSEAYSAAVMTPAQLRASNLVLLVSAVAQTATGVLALHRFGPAALLAGMAAGLLLRIGAAFRFAVAAHDEASSDCVAFVVSLLPERRYVLALRAVVAHLSMCRCRRMCLVLLAGAVTTAASNSALQAAPFSARRALYHLAVGLVVAAVSGFAALRWERDTVAAVRATLRAGSKRD